jgi:hypothetical protein
MQPKPMLTLSSRQCLYKIMLSPWLWIKFKEKVQLRLNQHSNKSKLKKN